MLSGGGGFVVAGAVLAAMDGWLLSGGAGFADAAVSLAAGSASAAGAAGAGAASTALLGGASGGWLACERLADDAVVLGDKGCGALLASGMAGSLTGGASAAGVLLACGDAAMALGGAAMALGGTDSGSMRAWDAAGLADGRCCASSAESHCCPGRNPHSAVELNCK